MEFIAVVEFEKDVSFFSKIFIMRPISIQAFYIISDNRKWPHLEMKIGPTFYQ